MLPRSVAALEERDRLITYLQNQSGRLGYDACRKQGIPVGSGGIGCYGRICGDVDVIGHDMIITPEASTALIVTCGSAFLAVRRQRRRVVQG